MNKLKQLKNIIITKPQKLDCGKEISNFPISYETYGTLNEKKDNAILVFHALTGDQFASGKNPITNKDGWWSYALGSGKAIDTEKFFVICANVIGGCMGSYGPSTIDEETGKPIGTNFPVITINDMVNAQYNLLEHFKIDKLFAGENTSVSTPLADPLNSNSARKVDSPPSTAVPFSFVNAVTDADSQFPLLTEYT